MGGQWNRGQGDMWGDRWGNRVTGQGDRGTGGETDGGTGGQGAGGQGDRGHGGQVGRQVWDRWGDRWRDRWGAGGGDRWRDRWGDRWGIGGGTGGRGQGGQVRGQVGGQVRGNNNVYSLKKGTVPFKNSLERTLGTTCHSSCAFLHTHLVLRVLKHLFLFLRKFRGGLLGEAASELDKDCNKRDRKGPCK